MLDIFPAGTAEHIRHFHELFREYEKQLNVDLCFQDFERELANLPGVYAPPEGCMLLAEYDSKIAGCVALKKIGEGICEMKRLYVRPRFRELGVGRALSEAIIVEARTIGYSLMRLDTVPPMAAAKTLYKSLGFEAISPYRHNPIHGAVFMELALK